LDPEGILAGGGAFSFLSPSNQSLFLLGASGTIPVIQYHRVWTLISASFLHGGIMHIAFNMMALYQLGPFVLREFGFHRFINLYIITGACGFAASVLFGVPFTIGASASICGLIGSIIYYGKSRGGSYGEAIYKQAMGWVVGLIFFGIIFPGINNWAHGGGILSGILLAFLMGFNDNKQEKCLEQAFGLCLHPAYSGNFNLGDYFFFAEWQRYRDLVTGMNPKASCGILYPPLRGIVQLSNSDA